MRWDQPIRYASVSDIGFRRRNNQDSYAVRMCSDAEIWREHGHLLMVADGMGGHAVGELASKIAADTVCHTFYKIRNTEVPDALKQALETANAAINERGSLNRDFARMGTTCTALALCPQGAVIGHVGDSRLYRVRGDRIDQLTADHSVQWELMRQGRLRPDEVFLHESRHVITRSLGPEPVVQVDIEGPYAVLPGDVYLICSDGLTGHVQDAEIGIIASELPPPEACRMLVNLANLRGGSDNVTVVIARVANVAGSDAEEETVAPMPGLGWGWIITIWCLALLFVAGVVSFLFDHPVPGVCLLAAASFLGVGAFAYWLERRPRRPRQTGEEGVETTVWRPYRSASARPSIAFLNHLASLEGELARAASEERWSIDWPAQQAARALARGSLEAKNYPKALSELAKVIDILMAGLLQHRKQIQRQSKWGKPTTPNATPNSTQKTNPTPVPKPSPAAEELPDERGA
ncbi:MAG TPA: PP2C family serine/threonine-protein phosphatase [Planctomycetaceae bacterium]|nr:PP2C family serine/threonine-protein phosphatase [Planctomycetaceae bacterium]